MIKNKLINHYLDKSFECYSSFRNKKAIEYVDKALFLDENNVECLLSKGLFYSALFDRENSFKCFDLAMEIEPNSCNILYQKGLALMNLDEYDLALDCFEEILNFDSDNIDVLRQVGLCHYYMEDYCNSIIVFQRIMSFCPNDLDSIICISGCHVGLNDFENALKYVDYALDIDNMSSMALSRKSDILSKMGDYHAAINLMDRCLELNPDNLSYQISRCSLLVSIGSFEEALIGFEKVHDTYFDDYNLVDLFYLKYGQALQRMGKNDEALVLYDEFLIKYEEFPKDDIIAERDKVLGQLH